MANPDTFDVLPIGQFVKRYLAKSVVSIDPFARNKGWATYTNDLNPVTSAQHHMDALDFLEMLITQGVKADLVIFDPPYSPRQIKECYEGVGLKMKKEDAWRTNGWTKEKKACNDLLSMNGVFLYFGWNTVGMGNTRGFQIEEILMICHGPGHNDTLCMAERKIGHQLSLF